MKKHSDYRLIKEYPGSYKIGYILKALNGYEAGKYWINNNWFCPEDYPEYWEIAKDPIFTTEDVVDYYNENDLVWDTHNYSGNSPAIFSNPGFLTQTEVKWANGLRRKFFSTKEAAEKYKEENKPQYSMRDLLSFGCYARGYNTGATTKDCFTGWIESPQKPNI